MASIVTEKSTDSDIPEQIDSPRFIYLKAFYVIAGFVSYECA
jgi:hypothetical protein